MIYLLLALLCSATITVCMRLSEKYRQNPISMLAVNYLVCSLLAVAFSGQWTLFPKDAGLPTTLLLGGICGVLFLSSFMLLQWNVSRNGVALPATFMKLGVLVPTLLSALVFGEELTLLRILGVIVAVAAILLMQDKAQKEAGGSMLGLIALLLSGGLSDFMSTLYEELGAPNLKDQFLLYTFLVALILSVVLCLIRKETLRWQDALFGVLLSVPNYLSTRFLLLSLNHLPAVVVFPSFSAGTLVLATLAGSLLCTETLTTRNGLALVVILAALVLLNL